MALKINAVQVGTYSVDPTGKTARNMGWARHCFRFTATSAQAR